MAVKNKRDVAASNQEDDECSLAAQERTLRVHHGKETKRNTGGWLANGNGEMSNLFRRRVRGKGWSSVSGTGCHPGFPCLRKLGLGKRQLLFPTLVLG